MPEISVVGGTIHYEKLGRGIPVVLTPGGRWAGYVQRVVATELAGDFQVILWDRRNTDGKSSIAVRGARSEADLWADDLARLIQSLGLGPCYVGEYAGCRTTPLLCLKYPKLVKGLMLAWPSGGAVPAEGVPRVMYRPYIRAALRLGMAGVVKTAGAFTDSIKKNRANRERLLAMKPGQFIRQMAYWEAFFHTSADLPIAGCRATEEQWASIKVPAIVTGGCDPIHPTAVARRLHRLLPNSRYHAPVVTAKEWSKIFEVQPYPVVSNLQGKRIAPVWRSFLKQVEAEGGIGGSGGVPAQRSS